MQKTDDESGWIRMAFDDKSKKYGSIASKVGFGYHREGVEAGSAPCETSYWLNGALVHLTTDLMEKSHQDKAIAEAVEIGRGSTRGDAFNAILMSIRHVMLLKVFPSRLERTVAMPLLQVSEDTDQNFSRYHVTSSIHGKIE